MSQAYISTRCKKILYMIIASDEYVPLKQICEEFKLSKRSIYYEICKINDWLNSQGICEIEVARGKGIKLSEEEKKQIELAMEEGEYSENYIFSPMERIYYIICYIIKSQKAVSADYLAEKLVVSRNTIFNDLRVVVKQLQDYDLVLKYESKKGYIITGDGIRVRALFMLYFNMLRPMYESGVLQGFIDEDDKQKNLHKLQEIEAELNNSYVDGTLLSLSLLIPLMEESDGELYFPDLKKEELENTREFELVEKYFPHLCEKEKIYLCLHLLGSRVSVNAVDVFRNESMQSNYEIAKALVAEFEKKACVVFENKEDLEKALYYHFNTSMYRLQYGIQVGNPMFEDITREYPELFDITKMVCHYLEQQIGLPISDGEVAYLTLHFGAHLKKEKTDNTRVRVLIVCSNGISAGNMIKHELLKMLPNIEIVGVIASKEAVNMQQICDVVITTIKMKCLVPVIVVHPILTDFDRKLILNHSIFRNAGNGLDLDKLFERIKKYVPVENHNEMRQEIVSFFNNNYSDMVSAPDKKKPGLLSKLYPENIMIEEGICTWENAIENVGRPLIEQGVIDEKYISNIIGQIKFYGPYMFITSDVVLAHTKPEDDVNDLGISMGIFKKPVVFSDFHKAKIIMVMSVNGQEKHLKLLKDIMNVFSNEENAEKLTKCKNAEETLHTLKNLIDKIK